ncbi:MAG: L,D-transpeptidase family protein [Planctomycetota bacterium]|jgi:lipoprotein-anchoring transpeptidase ErfK/SrfK
MARHHASRGRNQNVIYIVVGLVAMVVIIGLISGIRPFGADGSNIPVEPNNNALSNESPPVENDDSDISEAIEIEKPEPNIPPIVVDPPKEVRPATDLTADMIAEATALLSGTPNRIIEGRDKLNAALKMPITPGQSAVVKAQLSKLADQWLFSKTFFAQDKLCSSYKVQSGDNLATIAKNHKVPYEILMEINSISRPELLQAGQRIKVVHGPFHAKVYRSKFKMDVYLQGTYVKTFPVGLGAPGRQTPLGLWHIKAGGKIPHAIYTDPDTGEVIHPEDPAYPLGSRWMELEGLDDKTREESGFGIHGTKDPESIGKASSRGCVRLHNGDAIKVYNMLVPVKSLVKILE